MLRQLIAKNQTLSRRTALTAGASGAALQLLGCAVPQFIQDQDKQVSSDALEVQTSQPVTRIGFGSCIDQSKPQLMWAPILASDLDLFIFGGDNVYASQQPFNIANTYAAYAALKADPGFAKLWHRAPNLAIWDDHDFGLNDGGANFPHKQATKEAFLKFWQVADEDPRRLREGLYHAKTYGPLGQRVQIILLDVRWNKSPWKPTDQRDAPGKERYIPDPDTSKTMLGETQWLWLEAQLRQPADLRLIVSGVQVLADGHGWESWALFPKERQRLYDLIEQTRAQGVVMLSGDRHIGAMYQAVAKTPYPLFEVTSSGMTHPWAQTKEAGPNRLGPLVTQLHFGMVEIDWSMKKVSLQLRGQNNQRLQEKTLSLSDLVPS